MKNTLLLITLTCLFACAKQTTNDPIIDIQVKEHIPATVIDSITGISFFDIRVIDSLLVLLDRQSTNFFSVYSKRDYHKIKDFGEKGSGPFDYIRSEARRGGKECTSWCRSGWSACQ